MTSFITIIVKQTGFHRWDGAPNKVLFLGSLHRHTFHIKVRLHVEHDDRDLEFTLLKRDIEFYLSSTYEGIFDGLNFGPNSCEMLSKNLFMWLISKDYSVIEVSFSEDGEFEGGVRVGG